MIFEDTIALLHGRYGGKLRDITLDRVVIGVFFTGVKLSNGAAGVCYTPLEEMGASCCRHSMGGGRRGRGSFKGASAYDLFEAPERGFRLRAVKMALINALSAQLLLEGAYDLIPGVDTIDILDYASIQQVSMVGAFKTFLNKLKAMDGLRLKVVEKRMDALREDELRFFVPEDKARDAFAHSDVIIITGATVANDTIDGLLELVPAGATVVVIGPTASLIPDAFFARDVGVIGCAVVTDADECLDSIAQAGPLFLSSRKDCCKKSASLTQRGINGRLIFFPNRMNVLTPWLHREAVPEERMDFFKRTLKIRLRKPKPFMGVCAAGRLAARPLPD